jgi:hypothetical protein
MSRIEEGGASAQRQQRPFEIRADFEISADGPEPIFISAAATSIGGLPKGSKEVPRVRRECCCSHLANHFSFADNSGGHIFAGMADILESAPKYHEEPKLIIRKAPHVPVWSVWATLEGTHSEELFEGSTEEEASNWINSAGQVWLEERRRKRNA